ncbi:MAG: TetR/AcrR family transcriptional regulator [Anaerolineae bacterium]|nr:TetR/AcrR family transcriptional regulator [Anaerolineae bacterium]
MSKENIDRRVQRTRRLLERALIDLIIEKGFNKITVQDIIDRANVGRSTFYSHYLDKDDLLANSVEGLQVILSKQVAGGNKNQGIANVLPSLALFHHTKDGHALYKAVIGGGGIDLVVKGLREILMSYAVEQIKQITPEGTISHIPPQLIATYLTGALMELLMWWLDNGMPHSPEYMDEVYQKLAVPGILAATSAAPPPG